MKDQYNREIRYLRLSVTDLCNYRCIYCMPEDGVCKKRHSDILSLEELTAIAQAAYKIGIRKIRLTGGEPLVRRGIVDLCRNIRAVSPEIELAVTTNGSLLPQYAEELKHAGVDRLNISLDTLRADRFRELTRIGELDDVLRGIDAAYHAGFEKIKINTVLIGKVNDDEAEALVQLTKDRDISLRFIELMPMNVCREWDRSRFISTDSIRERLNDLQKLSSDGVSEVYQINGYRGTVGFISPLSHRFCSRCDRIRVTSDGKLKPCLHSAEEIDLRGLNAEELEHTLREGIYRKPAGHHLNTHATETRRSMNEIGG